MKLTQRGRFAVAYAIALPIAAAIGMCDPLWQAMPWAVGS